MNLELPEKEKIPKTRIAIYVSVIGICIIAIFVTVGVQILGNDVVNNFFGINKITKRTEQEEIELKANFEKIFDNQLKNKQDLNVEKEDKNRDIIFNKYQKEEKTDTHEISVKIPYINIKNEEVQKFNEEVLRIFGGKAEELINSKDENEIYTIKYKAAIENNILSLIIYSDLKQGTTAQRIIIQTFTYDLKQNKKINLQETLKLYNLDKNEIQNKINSNIKEEQRKAEDLKQIGYNVFSRDLKSTIYNIENITEFFVYDNNIYIIFAYGNNKETTEMDLVII